MIDRFEGKYRFLSNFADSTIRVDNLTFNNAEAAFQAHKVLTVAEASQFCKMEPRAAKALGRKVTLRKDWDKIRDAVMYFVVRAKFSQSIDLRTSLLLTKNEELVEGNTWGDTYWGVCNGKGENRLGITLMLVRDALRHSKKLSIPMEDVIYDSIMEYIKVYSDCRHHVWRDE